MRRSLRIRNRSVRIPLAITLYIADVRSTVSGEAKLEIDMKKHLMILAAVTTGTLALPLTASANEPSHNVAGERGVIFHDTRSDGGRNDARSVGSTNSGWVYVGGEAVWAYEGPGNRTAPRRSGRTDRAPATRTSERAPMQQSMFGNDIYHGA